MTKKTKTKKTKTKVKKTKATTKTTSLQKKREKIIKNFVQLGANSSQNIQVMSKLYTCIVRSTSIENLRLHPINFSTFFIFVVLFLFVSIAELLLSVAGFETLCRSCCLSFEPDFETILTRSTSTGKFASLNSKIKPCRGG